jgi:hypothetical protein
VFPGPGGAVCSSAVVVAEAPTALWDDQQAATLQRAVASFAA